MMKGLLLALAMGVSMSANAANTVFDMLVVQQNKAIVQSAHTMGLDWKVGDENNYNLSIGGFINGSMQMKCTSIGADGIWMDQNMDLGFAGKQQAQILIDPNTGEIKKMLVNGKEQQIPENNTEIVEVTEDKITVPAGTFECIHAKLKDSKTGEMSEAWINPEKVPLSGMLKALQPSQLGQVNIQLKSFRKQ